MKSSNLAICTAIFLTALALSSQAKADTLAYSVNASAAPDNAAYWGVNDVGWLYTPSASYNLSGIDTEFSSPNLTSVQERNVTVVVYQGNTPSNGGTLLGSFQFDSSVAHSTLGGGSFATPIALTGGQQYFIGFEDVGPLSPTPNVDDLGVNFTGDAGATFFSNAYYDAASNGSCSTANTFACEDPNADFQAQPILEFFQPSPVVSATPEPGSLLPLGGSALLLFGWFRRKRA